MKKTLCVSIFNSVSIDHKRQLEIFKAIGFDGFFTEYNIDDIAEFKAKADELGLIYQSVHAPFYKMNHMWEYSTETETAKQELKNCVEECFKNDVPIVVLHPYIGFDKDEPTELGIANFKEVVDYARERNIKIALENVEGEGYLAALMDAFENYDNVGFCWDTGHEMCYNRFKDMLEIYGDKLIATHINDNMGVTGEDITFWDDLHLLPFDGVKDWKDAMQRLDNCGFDGSMTFELKMTPEIDEQYGTCYTKMEFEDYLKELYTRALKLCDMRA